MTKLRADTHFETEVRSAKWDETEKVWKIKTKFKEIDTEENFTWLISCVGGLHKPFIPEFEGQKNFKGESFHTANWNHSVKLKGKKIGIIGLALLFTIKLPEILFLTMKNPRDRKWGYRCSSPS